MKDQSECTDPTSNPHYHNTPTPKNTPITLLNTRENSQPKKILPWEIAPNLSSVVLNNPQVTIARFTQSKQSNLSQLCFVKTKNKKAIKNKKQESREVGYPKKIKHSLIPMEEQPKISKNKESLKMTSKPVSTWISEYRTSIPLELQIPISNMSAPSPFKTIRIFAVDPDSSISLIYYSQSLLVL